MADDYCELCDLPRAYCVHGRPPPPPPAAAPRRPAPKPAPARRATGAGSGRPSAPAKPVVRRWTPPEVLAPVILDVLREAGGTLDQEAVFEAIEQRVGDDLRAGDRETTPEGELRWRYAARRARQSLIKEGLMVKGAPGSWMLG